MCVIYPSYPEHHAVNVLVKINVSLYTDWDMRYNLSRKIN